MSGECKAVFGGDLEEVLEGPAQHISIILYTVYQLSRINAFRLVLHASSSSHL